MNYSLCWTLVKTLRYSKHCILNKNFLRTFESTATRKYTKRVKIKNDCVNIWLSVMLELCKADFNNNQSPIIKYQVFILGFLVFFQTKLSVIFTKQNIYYLKSIFLHFKCIFLKTVARCPKENLHPHKSRQSKWFGENPKTLSFQYRGG